MSIKIVIDMNLSNEWVEIFRSQGWEAVHWSSLGAPDARDEAIMAWAVVNQHIVFTHDLDFSAILASTKAPAPQCDSVADPECHAGITSYNRGCSHSPI